ncbi:5-methylcytosine restriction system specificity protein McrC [Gottfriedia acidiceleris]|uniref:5-methylcytosine restriction system specificity protein McrC n=1 Tax=Gottfriedia acidiceleris TaxID=371036 RepID=UPI002FFFDD2E
MSFLENYSRIPIKNIYYMLCYAWDRLEEMDKVNVGQEDDIDLYHLITRVLLNDLKVLIKKGFYREYVVITEESSTLKGQIQFQPSIRDFTYKRGKMVCSYDEMSHDILHNQIIKTTLYYLLKNNHLEIDMKEKVHHIFKYFQDVSLIQLNNRIFSNVKIHRSNQHYGFTIDLCKLLFDSLLINNEETSFKYKDFEQNHKAMAALFENFVRNFYKKELPHYKVYRENIDWIAEGNDLSLLPRMQTDVSMENDQEKIIMDTKFYHKVLTLNYDTEKLISGNLYQLLSYLNNRSKTSVLKQKKGILLYPRVDRTLNAQYRIQGFPIKVCTVDLNLNWKRIHESLHDVITFN